MVQNLIGLGCSALFSLALLVCLRDILRWYRRCGHRSERIFPVVPPKTAEEREDLAERLLDQGWVEESPGRFVLPFGLIAPHMTHGLTLTREEWRSGWRIMYLKGEVPVKVLQGARARAMLLGNSH